MTLILTELTDLGIAMATDSAVTYTNNITGLSHVRPNKAKKLQVVPYLNAGISCWGMGTISGISTDQWLSDFIASNSSWNTLKDFASNLARELNANLQPNTSGEGRIGFHLAGYEEYKGVPTPSFYHIHDGPSTTLQQRGITIDPYQVNPNHDIPPDIFQNCAPWITRNGDYELYATIFDLLEDFFNKLEPMGIIIPASQNLLDRVEYLIFQIRTVSEIYRLSNLVPGIGGGIHYLTINQAGIHSQGIRFF